MMYTLASEYFTIIGSLSTSLEGQKVLQRCRVYTTLYQVADLKVRDDVIRAMVCALDYNRYVRRMLTFGSDSHERIILSKILTSGSHEIRLFCTYHLHFLNRNQPGNFGSWAVSLALTQLFDVESDVKRCARKVLDEAFDSPENLLSAFSDATDLSHLIDVAGSLLPKLISIPEGFKLFSTDYITKEMDRWFQIGNLNYVAQLEQNISSALAKPLARKSTSFDLPIQFTLFGKTADQEQMKAWYLVVQCEVINIDFACRETTGLVPTHFFGELVKTEAGRALLAERDYLSYFVEFLQLWGLKNVTGMALRKVKAVLWALVLQTFDDSHIQGHIGSSVEGLALLQRANVIEAIINISQYSEVFSLRGFVLGFNVFNIPRTCCHVLGLISMTNLGAEVLRSHQWDVVVRKDGHHDGICIPSDIGRLLCV